MKKVLLLFGGNSPEHNVSCMSAKSILENINTRKYKVTPVVIDYRNNWHIYQGHSDNVTAWRDECLNKVGNIIDFIKGFDVVFPIIHGSNGEDGRLQGMCDLFNIKYVGCNTLSSALGMDKEYSKIIFTYLGIPQIPFLVIKKEYNVDEMVDILGLPLIVKPANGGSSIGISKVNSKKELKKAIEIARKIDKKVIVEKFIKARELECAVLEDKKLVISNVGEIKSANEFYDYEAKYIDDKSYTIIPADISNEVRELIKEYSKKAFIGINACGLSRIDFLYDEENNQVYLNEINTLPGFTNISMYPQLLITSGYSYQELLSALIESSL